MTTTRRSSRRAVMEEDEVEEPSQLMDTQAQEDEDDEEEDEEQGGELEDGAEDEEDETKEEDAAGEEAPPVKRQKTNETDEEARFPQGAIVRIRLKNFITYDAVEFRPGPNLNMIIGPNGTGKSSLVCAIALGLGGKPDALGRQKTLQDFIKDGQDKALIEIELKNRGRGGNVIIRRLFRRGDKNANMWKINGEHATEKALKEKMLSMKASADEKKVLDNLVSRNAILERDVNRFRERESVLERIGLLETKILWVKYGALRDQYLEARTQKEAKKVAYNAIKNESAPLREQYDLVKGGVEELQQKANRLTEKFQMKMTHKDELPKISGRLQVAEEDAEGLKSQLESAKKSARDKQKRLQVAQVEVDQLKAKIATVERELVEAGLMDAQGDSQEGGELGELKLKLEEKNVELRTLGDSINDARNQINEIAEEANQLRFRRERKYAELGALDNVRTQKLDLLRGDGRTRAAYQGAEWLKDHQDLFQKRVFDPICLEIQVTDPAMADTVESFVGIGHMATFVTQTDHDYHLLSKELIEKRKLRINIVQFSDKPLAHFRPDVPKEQIERLGFDGYVLDYLEGPPEVLSALCQLSKIHNIPVARRTISNIAQVESNHKIMAYADVATRTVYRIRRGYGSAAVTSNPMRPAHWLRGSVDMSQRTRLEQELESLKDEMAECAERTKGLSTMEAKLTTQDNKLRAEKSEIMDRRKEVQRKRSHWTRLKSDLGIKEMQYNNLAQDTGPPMEELELQFATKIKVINVQRVGLAQRYEKCLREAMSIFSERTMATLRHMEAAAKVQDLETALQESDARLIVAEEEVKVACAEVTDVKALAKAAMALAKAAPVPENTDIMEVHSDKSLDDLENMLMELTARADMINQTDAGVIHDFEKREVEIERLRTKIANTEGRLADWKGKMQRIKNKWEPELKSLVERISVSFAEAFDKIGCAGEVRLSPNDDYDKWGIDILVKFRDSEKLNQLTGQRQSGGERSVSTILYLMALQALSHTPFRVVDEINQGMDPRNERMVHGEMVRAACQKGTSQYFLITPKLLPDLDYHERMRVLCVFNGAYTPSAIDPKMYLARRLEKVRGRQAIAV
ncbi:Structural maintenance of chromosomes protein 5 [Thoreauomyces humboldtii]|nr:Structural maintenance of chromosomes protein 5 [Thoreauomyces humboldtii]